MILCMMYELSTLTLVEPWTLGRRLQEGNFRVRVHNRWGGAHLVAFLALTITIFFHFLASLIPVRESSSLSSGFLLCIYKMGLHAADFRSLL